MALIPKSEICTLVDAETASNVANSAKLDIEMMTIAAAINTAANSGEHKAYYQDSISEDALDTLTANGYHVQSGDTTMSRISVISW